MNSLYLTNSQSNSCWKHLRDERRPLTGHYNEAKLSSQCRQWERSLMSQDVNFLKWKSGLLRSRTLCCLIWSCIKSSFSTGFFLRSFTISQVADDHRNLLSSHLNFFLLEKQISLFGLGDRWSAVTTPFKEAAKEPRMCRMCPTTSVGHIRITNLCCSDKKKNMSHYKTSSKSTCECE